MSFLDKISNFYYKNRKNILYVLVFLFIFTVFTDLSFAEGTNNNPATVSAAWVKPEKTESNIFFDALNSLSKVIWAILWMLTFLVWLFLNPWWTSWSFIGLVDPLKTMWIMVSNIVYFIFAFIFIWIAFMNIIWKEDSYQLKQALPKFIVWVLIVPFSWFFVQFIISLSWILTVWILSLPYDTFKWTDFFSNLDKIEAWCKHFVIDKNDQKCDKDGKYKLSEILNVENSENLFWIMSFYTYAVMWLDDWWKLFEHEVKTFNNLVDLWVKVIIDIIFVIIYLLLLVALFLALLVRWVMLWLFSMFSPVFWLLYFFWKSSDWIWDWTKNFNIKQFIALAFVPVYVAWALAFWLVFIFIAWRGLTIWTDNEVTKILKVTDNWNTMEFWKLWSITWSWSTSNSAKVWRAIAWFQWSIWTTLLQLFWLWILWMAVMAALRSSEFTKAAVQPIADFGNSVWDLIKKAPSYAPIIPAPGWAISATWLARAWSTFTWSIEQSASQKWTDFWAKIAKLAWVDTDSAWAKLQKLRNETSAAMLSSADSIQKFVDKTIEATWDFDKFLLDKSAQAQFLENLKHAWFKKELVDWIKFTSRSEFWNTMAKLTNESQWIHRTAMSSLWLWTSPGVAWKFTWSKSENLAWDTTVRQISDEHYNSFSWQDIGGGIKIKKDEREWVVWIWVINVKNNNGDWAKEYSINLNISSDKADLNWVATSDKDELIKLYTEVFGSDLNNFKKFLKGLWLREDLWDAVKTASSAPRNNSN